MLIKPGKEKAFEDYKALNSKDGYSSECVAYGERWADLMEKKLRETTHTEDLTKLDDFMLQYRIKNLVRFAEEVQPSKLSHEADTTGITGFMYGAGAATICEFWLFGDHFRKWFNISEQIRDEGEKANEKPGAVLNPAIMVVGG